MAEENASSSAPPQNGGAASATPASEPVTEAQILNGGIEIDVVKIDGSSEPVKVRQLPVSLVGEWAKLEAMADEANLIELLCDRVDRTTRYHLDNLRRVEMRTHAILLQADFKQMEAIEKYLIHLREEIARHEAKERWSDTVTHESVAEIRALGLRLNKKKYADQLERNRITAKALLEALPKSPEQSSSSPSPASAASPSAT